MEKILFNWLAYQCCTIDGAIRGTVLTGPSGTGPYNQVLLWSKDQREHSALALSSSPSHVLETVLLNKKPVIENRNNTVEETGEPVDTIASPLVLNDNLIGCVAIEMTSRSSSMQKAALKQIRAGVNLLDAMATLHSTASRDKDKLINLLSLVSAGLEHEKFETAAASVAGMIADRFSCRLVGLGFLRRNRVRVEAISCGTNFDSKSSLVQSIQDAMGEAVDQGRSIVFPDKSENALVAIRFHSQLAKEQIGASICTVPLTRNGKPVGALLLERPPEEPFSSETVSQCEQISPLLGTLLETRRRDEQPLAYKLLDSLKGFCGKLLGPRHAAMKLGFGLGAVLVLWLFLAGAMFRVSTDAGIEASIRRVVVSPQQGFIAESHVRAGDFVQAGTIMATLDDKELLLEQRKWQSQLDQYVREYRKALAEANRSEVAVLNAKKAQAEAQLRLVQQQLERSELVAPISGHVVKGDLSQALGSPVERGEALFEVAPTDEYRVVLKIDDRDIGLITIGQRGRLKLSGIPERYFDIQIDRVTPVSENDGGRNYFRVEAAMETQSDLMRPGMEGIAKVDIGRKRLIWILTRRLMDGIRLFVWKWMP